jgi:hypothetical protein
MLMRKILLLWLMFWRAKRETEKEEKKRGEILWKRRRNFFVVNNNVCMTYSVLYKQQDCCYSRLLRRNDKYESQSLLKYWFVTVRLQYTYEWKCANIVSLHKLGGRVKLTVARLYTKGVVFMGLIDLLANWRKKVHAVGSRFLLGLLGCLWLFKEEIPSCCQSKNGLIHHR